MRRRISVFTAAYKEEFMNRLLVFALLCVAAAASAQAQNRIRGTITGVVADALIVKTGDGKDVHVQLTPDAQVSTTKRAALADFKPGSYVGVTSLRRSDGVLVASRVHALGPQVPAGHIPKWDSIPDSLMTNANIESMAQVSGGSELVLKYKDGEQKILVTPTTQYFTFAPGTKDDLRPGERIFTNAKGEGSKFVASRVTVSKDGVNPPQ
jgi:hypothetical protein